MNFKNENNNNENMNKEVELNNNKGEIKMNNKKICPLCKKEFEPIEFIKEDLITGKKTKELPKYCPSCSKIMEAELEEFLKEKTTITQKDIQQKEKEEIQKQIKDTKQKDEEKETITNGTIQKVPHKKTNKECEAIANNNKKERKLFNTNRNQEITTNQKELTEKQQKALNTNGKKLNETQLEFIKECHFDHSKLKNFDKKVLRGLVNASKISDYQYNIKTFGKQQSSFFGEVTVLITLDQFKEIAPTIYKEVGNTKGGEIFNKIMNSEFTFTKTPQEVESDIEAVKNNLLLTDSDKNEIVLKINTMMKEAEELLNKYGVDISNNDKMLWSIWRIEEGKRAVQYTNLKDLPEFLAVVKVFRYWDKRTKNKTMQAIKRLAFSS